MSHFEELLQCPYNRAHHIQPHAMLRHLFKCRKNNPSTKLVCCPFNTIHRVPGPELKLHIDNCEDRATFDLYKYCISSVASNNSNDYKDEGPELIYHHASPAGGSSNTVQQDKDCWHNYKTPAKVIRKPTQKKPLYDEEQDRHNERKSVSEKNNYDSRDRDNFMSYRGSVPESKYYNGKSIKVPGKTLLDDDECWDDSNVPAYNPQEYCKNARVIRKATLMKPSQKKQFYYQENQRLRAFDNRSRPVSNDVDEISAKFTRSMDIKCK